MNDAQPTLVLRAAIESDADALTELVFRSKASHGYDEAFMAACREELAVTPATLRVDHWWLVESDHALGCCQLSHDGPVGTIEAFFVAPQAQRQGVGRLLWAALRARAVELQLTRLQLDADPGATGFYERLGLVVTGQVPSGCIADRLLPRMTLQLPAASR